MTPRIPGLVAVFPFFVFFFLALFLRTFCSYFFTHRAPSIPPSVLFRLDPFLIYSERPRSGRTHKRRAHRRICKARTSASTLELLRCRWSGISLARAQLLRAGLEHVYAHARMHNARCVVVETKKKRKGGAQGRYRRQPRWAARPT